LFGTTRYFEFPTRGGSIEKCILLLKLFSIQFFKATSVNIFVSVFLPVAEVIVAEVDDLMLTNAKKRREAFKRITKAVDKAKMQWKPHLVNLIIEMAVSELKSRRLDG